MPQVYQDETGAQTPAAQILGPIKKKVEAAKRDRARFEAVWHSNRAFAAGRHWLKHSRGDRRLVLDPRDVQNGKQRVTVDLLSQYLHTALGQLRGAEERPQLLFRRDDLPSEDFTKTANSALQYGWDSEWEAKRQLERVKRRIIVDGTAAIQCLFDPTVGKELGDVPLRDGKPLLDETEARAYVAELAAAGQTAQYKRLNEGRVCWKPRSVFNLLIPAGLEDEEEFPWVAIVSAVPLESLIARYGEQARQLKAEPLAALEVMGLKDSGEHGLGSDEEDYGAPGKLEDHAALVEFYEQPTSDNDKGRVVTYARDLLLEVKEELPYKRPNGDYCDGIAFFHYWRVEGRFWGRGLIEPGKGIQRTYNKRCQQEQLTIDRGQPKVFIEDTQKVTVTGTPMEILRYKAGTPLPEFHQGMSVGDSMWRSKEGLLSDLERAMGIHGVSVGEEPSRQTTYAELALRSEKDRTKTDPITDRFQASKNRLVEFSVWDMRRYWPRSKIIALVGEAGEAESVEFSGAQLPEFFLLKVAEGSKPRDQASEIQLIFDLYTQAQNIMQPLPLHWLKDSVDAGKALPLPENPTDVHLEKAEWENSQMWEGSYVQPKAWDPPEVHIPAHREAQVEAEMAGRPDIVALIQKHLDETEMLAEALAVQQAQKMAARQAQLEQPPAPPTPPADQQQQSKPSGGASG